jgi:hypothetical protein
MRSYFATREANWLYLYIVLNNDFLLDNNLLFVIINGSLKYQLIFQFYLIGNFLCFLEEFFYPQEFFTKEFQNLSLNFLFDL